MRSRILRRVSYIFLWYVVALGFVISCDESIKVGHFRNKDIDKNVQNIFKVETVFYKYSDKIIVSWNKVHNATNYFVYVLKNKTDTIESKRIPDFIAGFNVFKHEIRISSDFTETRYIVVVARDAAGNSLNISDMVEGKTLGAPIINPSQVKTTFYSVSFGWSPVEGVSRYAVQRKKKGEIAYKNISSALKQNIDGVWSLVDETVEANSVYNYRVLGYVVQGEEVITERSREFSVRTPQQNAPHAVNNFAASKYVYVDKVLLVWDEPDSLIGFNNADLRYTIKRRIKNNDELASAIFVELDSVRPTELEKLSSIDESYRVLTVFKTSNENSFVYKDRSVEINTIYEYKIVASYVQDDTHGPFGTPSASVQGASIPRPKGLVARDSKDGVILQWSMPSDFTGLAAVHRSRGGLRFKTINTRDVKGTSYVDAEVKSNLRVTYTYKVRLFPPLFFIDKTSRNAVTRGLFSDTVSYNPPAQADYTFNFSILQGKKNVLRFTWDTPQNIAVKGSNFFIEHEKKGIFKKVILSDNPTVNARTGVGSATLSVNAASYEPTLYRLAFTRDRKTIYSKAVKGTLLRAVSALDATKGTNAQYITVSWQPSYGAQKYKVKLRASDSILWRVHQFDGQNFITPQNGNKGLQRVNITPPENNEATKRGTVYKIQIVAVGENELTDVIESKKIVEGFTFGPTGMNVSATEGTSREKITVSWSQVEKAEKYVVLRRLQGTGNEHEREIAEVSARIGTRTYKYDDLLENAQYLNNNVSPLNPKHKYEYRILPTKRGISSAIASVQAVGYLQIFVPRVTGVNASDVDYTNDRGIYIARHGDSVPTHSSKSNIYNINRERSQYYATKVSWNAVPVADKYHIYRMDFNENKSFWRKIGERQASDTHVFFDTKALILREYRTLYWVVAFAMDSDNVWRHDASLSNKPKNTLTHTDVLLPSFNAAEQTSKINTIIKQANVDVGNRWISPREYLNWSLNVIGDGVYTAYETSNTSYGLKRTSWSYIVSFTMNDYSLGARAGTISDSNRRRLLRNTELVVNTNNALSGSFSEACPSGSGSRWNFGCYGAINSRLGTYAGNNTYIIVNSPYGEAFVKISGLMSSSVSVSHKGGLYYNFGSGTIGFAWDNFDANNANIAAFKASKTVRINNKLGFEFSKAQNQGVQDPHNPYVTPIRFNRDYKTFLNRVYGYGR